MGYNCCNSLFEESGFLTREEKIDLLREYEQDLKREVQSVEQKIKELELN